MITIIDNYDSFTYNLVHYFGDLGVEARVYRNDEKTAAEVIAEAPEAIVHVAWAMHAERGGHLPRPDRARTRAAFRCSASASATRPSGRLSADASIRAPVLMHGKMSKIHHEGTSLFRGLPDGFEATRYHSLIVESDTLPDCLTATARTADGLIMALEHKSERTYGVQFHPESIASENGHAILANFLMLAGVAWSPRKKILPSPTSTPRAARGCGLAGC